ncbi:MAG: Asp-tRNA(Asn)/Glu-tRNA(Gln) amidotransferase GatCAB subunit B, partial [Puniceicoccales bacterium]|nr:Asp-tRNA(Asn)/Glu-tRNA(Gln) amidotransferase GatCAB subunit B [Puniceicoccales bacterium]
DDDRARLAATLPETPFVRQRRYFADYQLPYTLTSVLIPDRALCEYFEAALAAHPTAPLAIANFIANDLLGALAAIGAVVATCPVSPAHLAALVKLTDQGVISKQQAKEVFADMFATGKDPVAIVDAKGLRQSSDTGEIEKIIREVLALPTSAKPVAEFKAGNEKALNSLKGPVMKASQGKANPKLVDEIIRRLIV